MAEVPLHETFMRYSGGETMLEYGQRRGSKYKAHWSDIISLNVPNGAQIVLSQSLGWSFGVAAWNWWFVAALCVPEQFDRRRPTVFIVLVHFYFTSMPMQCLFSIQWFLSSAYTNSPTSWSVLSVHHYFYVSIHSVYMRYTIRLLVCLFLSFGVWHRGEMWRSAVGKFVSFVLWYASNYIIATYCVPLAA